MQDKIIVRGAREHNLKNINVEMPRNKLVCITGVSGSGKSSLAFDTIFAEGQRRYVESLSAYARQFLGQMEKPDVDDIEGLSPAISIDQKAHSSNPRSTVATITEIYDYLRVLYARVGKPHCPKCGEQIQKLTNEEMVDVVLGKVGEEMKGSLKILAPVVVGRKGEYYQLLYDLYNAGFARVRIDGKEYRLDEKIELARYQQHTIEVVVDTIPVVELLETSSSSATPLPPPSPSKGEGARKETRQRLAEALETAVEKGNDVATIVYPDKSEQMLSAKFSCPNDGFSFPEIEPRLFSFNSPYGACQACTGLGTVELFSEELCETCHGARLRSEALHVWLPGVGKGGKVVGVPFACHPQHLRRVVGTHAGKKKKTPVAPIEYTESDELIPMAEKKGVSIVDITNMSIDEAVLYFKTIDVSEKDLEIAGSVLREIENRLKFMLDVGLHYLSLDRRAGTLSGGEAQRIRLASQVGSRLVGAMYVLDEPTIGLHQRDNDKLIKTLENLRDLGNTVIVVEHDEDTIMASDYMIEIGPGAGVHGGYVVAAGETPAIFEDKKSLTAAYLRGDQKIEVPAQRRQNDGGSIRLKGATQNNLKNIDVEFPLRKFVCVTGVSGSGKSTLAYDTMYKTISKRLYGGSQTPGKHKALLGLEYIDKAILIDQDAIGRTSRSNPATYTGAWAPIRELYAETAEAKFRGYKVGRFSFNRPGGRCEHCEGHGLISIEMHFLPTVYVTCDICKGKRFDRETLEITFKEKNIHDVLEMTIEEATVFFKEIPYIYDKLASLNDVGLSYVKLGQPAPTLSGGEAQRVKLATELSKRQTGRTLYLFDEPTTGLHFADVKKLLEVMHSLVDKGNSVIVIEHNLDVIKTADWIIDMGPEVGDKGGTVVYAGTPEEVARHKGSHTGEYLKRVLRS